MKMDRNFPLIPEDSELDSWQLCMKEAIIDIQSKAKPYGRGGHGGVTEHLYYQGKRVGYAGGYSYCVGATYEAFIKAWKLFSGEQEYEGNMTKEQAWEMRAHFFAYMDRDEHGNYKYWKGAQGGIEWLAKQPGMDWLEYEIIEDPRQVRFGDFVSMQFTRDPMASGHAVIGLGNGQWKGEDVIHCWSSNNYYDKNWTYSKDQPPGNGWDYYYIDRKRDGFKRKFFITRIIGG